MTKNKQKYRFQCVSRMFRRVWVGVLLILLFSHSISAAGALDPNFGSGGKVSFRFGGTSDIATAAALQPDGKIVIVGNSYPSGQSTGLRDFAVARLNADGTLDNTFGSGGLVITAFGFQQEDTAYAVVIQPDGKIVVGGRNRAVFALARLHPNGSLDTTFGSGGKVTTDFTESLNEGIEYLFLQADGKILAAGSLIPSDFAEGQGQIGLVRYSPDGSLDATFGTGGKFKIFFDNLITYFDGAAMQPDGKLLVSGSYDFRIPNCTPTKANSCTAGQQFLLRYNQNMSLDRKFGRRFGKEFSRNKFYGLSLQPDGRILVGGFPLVRRYSVNGRLETVFEQSVFPNQPPNQFFVNGPFQLTQRPNGMIVGCQYLRAFGHDDIGVVLFNGDGHAVAYDQRDFFGADDGCRKILLQPDGKIVVVGYAQQQQQGNYSFAVMRYSDITP